MSIKGAALRIESIRQRGYNQDMECASLHLSLKDLGATGIDGDGTSKSACRGSIGLVKQMEPY